MEWKDVIGQEAVKQRLTQLLDEGRVPHALLLCGPEGTGKMALAMAFACQLLRRHPHPAAQDALLRQWQHPDLHFSFPTIKSPGMSSEHQPVSNDYMKEWRQLISQGPYFTLEQWMEQMGAANQQAIITAAESDELARKLSLKSSQGGYKVAIIWQPERMNLASANKMLKLLEEPPQQTVFLMVSEAPERLLETIRSRTQRITTRRLAEEEILRALMEQRGLEQDDAQRIARLSNGSWIRALEALNADNENRQFLELFITLMRQAYSRDVKNLKRWSEEVATLGREKQRRMLTYFNRMVRENFVYNFHEPQLNYMAADEEHFSRRFSPFINEANIIEISELLERAFRDIGQNANAKIVFYDLALQMIVLLLRK